MKTVLKSLVCGSKRSKKKRSHHTPPAFQRGSVCLSLSVSLHFISHLLKSLQPPPTFTFASVALFLNQVMRKHEDDFSCAIIMDGTVGKKKINQH